MRGEGLLCLWLSCRGPHTAQNLEPPQNKGARKVTWSVFHTEESQMLGSTIQNGVTQRTWHPGLFLHHCCNAYMGTHIKQHSVNSGTSWTENLRPITGVTHLWCVHILIILYCLHPCETFFDSILGKAPHNKDTRHYNRNKGPTNK